MTHFGELRRQLGILKDPRTLHDLHNLAGRDIAALVQQGFTRQRDPDGVPWLPSQAARREGRKTLRKTGALQDGIIWRADFRGVTVMTTGRANQYAAYHQRGTRKLPKRVFLPEAGHLPAGYERKLVNSFRAYFASRLGP